MGREPKWSTVSAGTELKQGNPHLPGLGRIEQNWCERLSDATFTFFREAVGGSRNEPPGVLPADFR